MKNEVIGLIRFKFYLRHHSAKKVTPSLGKISKDLEKIGIVEQDIKNKKIPAKYNFSPPRAKPILKAMAGQEVYYLQIVLTFFAGWMGKKVLDTAWDMIKESLKYKTVENNNYTELLFESSQDECTLVIRIDQSSNDEFKENKYLIPKVMKAARKWVKKNGYTHKKIIYHIKDGKYSKAPILRNDDSH